MIKYRVSYKLRVYSSIIIKKRRRLINHLRKSNVITTSIINRLMFKFVVILNQRHSNHNIWSNIFSLNFPFSLARSFNKRGTYIDRVVPSFFYSFEKSPNSRTFLNILFENKTRISDLFSTCFVFSDAIFII